VDETKNSTPLLREAVEAIESAFPDRTLTETITHVLVEHAKLPEELARECGVRIERLAAAYGRSWPHPARTSTARMREITERVNAQAVVSFVYDIPALAGYSKDGATIYMDRGLTRLREINGRMVDVSRYLVLHEVIEKSLLDACRFSERGYQRAHQIAQRLEREAVRADDLSWLEYQRKIMTEEIDRAYTKPALSLPPDLDETPYRDTDDLQILKPEEQLFVPVRLAPGVYHLRFKNAVRMASALMRFQEFYESRKFRGTYFSREEFEAWYATMTGGSTYAHDWAHGFNFPGSVLRSFFKGKFSPLTVDESQVLRFFDDKPLPRTYVIATPQGADPRLLKHELAHALYFLDPEYKKEVNTALHEVDLEPLQKLFAEHLELSHYHKAVLMDEFQAYLAHGSHELQEYGLDLGPYRTPISQLQEIYKKRARVYWEDDEARNTPNLPARG
jgi:hypothetical protein